MGYNNVCCVASSVMNRDHPPHGVAGQESRRPVSICAFLSPLSSGLIGVVGGDFRAAFRCFNTDIINPPVWCAKNGGN